VLVLRVVCCWPSCPNYCSQSFFWRNWEDHCLPIKQKRVLCTRMWLKPLIIGNRPRNLHSRGQLHPWNAQIESSPQRKRLVYPCKSNTLLYCTKHPFIFSATYIEVLICKESSVVLYPKVSRYIDGHTINIASLASVYLLSHYDPPISIVVQICGDACYEWWNLPMPHAIVV